MMPESAEYVLDLTRTMGECCPRKNDPDALEPVLELVAQGDLIETESPDPTRRRFILV